MTRIFAVVIGMLLTVFAFCGCGGSATAEKRLTAELKHFIGKYIKSEFAKQIKLNNRSNAFRISENKLLLLEFDGFDVVQRQIPHNDLLEMALVRCYAGQELNIVCQKAAWSNLVEVNHARFKYRALITLDFIDSRRMWQRVPGHSVVMTVFKSEYTPDKLKSELMNNAVRALPDEKFDFNAIYSRPSSAAERKFTATFFVCYDPALPGWVPEDPTLAGDIAVTAPAADWLEHTLDKLKLANGVELYKDDLYWKNTGVIRLNYDKGLVFFRNKWIPAGEAGEIVKLDELVDKFDSLRSDIEELTAFLEKLKSFSSQMDLSVGWQKARSCAENHINNLRGNDDYRSLENFLELMQENPAYNQGFEEIKKIAAEAVVAVKRRINRQLDNTANDIKNSLAAVKKLTVDGSLNHNQINIECVRQDSALKKVCPQDSKNITPLLFQLRFLLLLKKRNIEEVNKLYKNSEYRALLRQLEDSIISDCKNCRKGIQKCIYCAKAPGICNRCNGLRDSDGNVCMLCKDNGRCVHCKGSRQMKCMNCQGRGFIILFSAAEMLCKQLFAEFEKILKNNIAELENKKLDL